MSEIGHIHYGQRSITFKIERSHRRKTVGIYVFPQSEVLVRAPEFLKADRIKEIIRKKAQWIIKKQELLKNQIQPYFPKEFVSGESFPYLGRNYRLKVVKSPANVNEGCKLINGRFLVETNRDSGGEETRSAVRKILEDWYVERAKQKIPERVELYAGRIGKWPKKVEIKNHKRIWGSCSSNGVVRFNWKIIMAPVTMVDYVIVHELCHLVYPHHSRLFWQKMGTILGDYAKRRQRLKHYSLQLRSLN
jgi:predicted metal-dependent hydrolase